MNERGAHIMQGYLLGLGLGGGGLVVVCGLWKHTSHILHEKGAVLFLSIPLSLSLLSSLQALISISKPLLHDVREKTLKFPGQSR